MHYRNSILLLSAIAGLASALPQGVSVSSVASQASQGSQETQVFQPASGVNPVAIVRRQRNMRPGSVAANGTYSFNMTLPANITLPSGVALPTNGSLPSGLPERFSSVFTEFVATATGAASTVETGSPTEAGDVLETEVAEE